MVSPGTVQLRDDEIEFDRQAVRERGRVFPRSGFAVFCRSLCGEWKLKRNPSFLQNPPAESFCSATESVMFSETQTLLFCCKDIQAFPRVRYVCLKDDSVYLKSYTCHLKQHFSYKLCASISNIIFNVD